jgi:hypothetical protein
VVAAAASLAGAASAPALFGFGPFASPVLMLDRCEPESFNAVLGEGTCVGNGNVTFDAFIATLQQRGEHPQWRFIPRQTIALEGGTVVAKNIGGEAHTFTEVAAFGGGFVEELNDLSRNPVPAPECALTLPDGGLAPTPGALATLAGAGETVVAPAGSRGVHRFICCIHPWMRTSVFTLGFGPH